MHLACSQYKSPNEAVNFDLNCIFIAVPKTGTTTVRSQVRSLGPFMIDNPHLSLAQIQSILYPYILKCNLGRNCNFPTPRELATDREVREDAIELFSTMFKFGSVRNPWARMFSMYRRKEGVQVSSQIPFSEFINNIQYASDTCLHPLKMASQLDWFRDKKGKIAMDYIFKLEEIEKAIEQIEEMSNGRITIQNKKKNVNPQSASYKDAYTQKEVKIVERLFQEEIEYLGYTF